MKSKLTDQTKLTHSKLRTELHLLIINHVTYQCNILLIIFFIIRNYNLLLEFAILQFLLVLISIKEQLMFSLYINY